MIILNIGSTGTGKTTFNKKVLEKTKKTVIIFDYQNEYNETENVYIITSFDTFLRIVENKNIKGCLFIVEEATIFFNVFDKTKAIDALVSNRHRNNDFVFTFHSLRSVPLYIIDLVDYIALGKTNDNETTVKRKYDNRIFNLFISVKNDENKYVKKICKLK